MIVAGQGHGQRGGEGMGVGGARGPWPPAIVIPTSLILGCSRYCILIASPLTAYHTPMKDLKTLHAKFCPNKHFGNFWKSSDYKGADKVLKDLNIPPLQRRQVTQSSPGHPSQTMVHPLISLAFMRWADPVLFYNRLHRIVQE